MEFNLEPLLNNNRLVVHCPERDIAIAFSRYIKERYPSRYFRGDPGESEYWDNQKENMCYIPKLKSGPHMQYDSIGYYRRNGYEIISVSDLMLSIDIGPIDIGEVDIKSLFGME